MNAKLDKNKDLLRESRIIFEEAISAIPKVEAAGFETDMEPSKTREEQQREQLLERTQQRLIEAANEIRDDKSENLIWQALEASHITKSSDLNNLEAVKTLLNALDGVPFGTSPKEKALHDYLGNKAHIALLTKWAVPPSNPDKDEEFKQIWKNFNATSDTNTIINLEEFTENMRTNLRTLELFRQRIDTKLISINTAEQAHKKANLGKNIVELTLLKGKKNLKNIIPEEYYYIGTLVGAVLMCTEKFRNLGMGFLVAGGAGALLNNWEYKDPKEIPSDTFASVYGNENNALIPRRRNKAIATLETISTQTAARFDSFGSIYDKYLTLKNNSTFQQKLQEKGKNIESEDVPYLDIPGITKNNWQIAFEAIWVFEQKFAPLLKDPVFLEQLRNMPFGVVAPMTEKMAFKNLGDSHQAALAFIAEKAKAWGKEEMAEAGKLLDKGRREWNPMSVENQIKRILNAEGIEAFASFDAEKNQMTIFGVPYYVEFISKPGDKETFSFSDNEVKGMRLTPKGHGNDVLSQEIFYEGAYKNPNREQLERNAKTVVMKQIKKDLEDKDNVVKSYVAASEPKLDFITNEKGGGSWIAEIPLNPLYSAKLGKVKFKVSTSLHENIAGTYEYSNNYSSKIDDEATPQIGLKEAIEEKYINDLQKDLGKELAVLPSSLHIRKHDEDGTKAIFDTSKPLDVQIGFENKPWRRDPSGELISLDALAEWKNDKWEINVNNLENDAEVQKKYAHIILSDICRELNSLGEGGYEKFITDFLPIFEDIPWSYLVSGSINEAEFKQYGSSFFFNIYKMIEQINDPKKSAELINGLVTDGKKVLANIRALKKTDLDGSPRKVSKSEFADLFKEFREVNVPNDLKPSADFLYKELKLLGLETKDLTNQVYLRFINETQQHIKDYEAKNGKLSTEKKREWYAYVAQKYVDTFTIYQYKAFMTYDDYAQNKEIFDIGNLWIKGVESFETKTEDLKHELRLMAVERLFFKDNVFYKNSPDAVKKVLRAAALRIRIEHRCKRTSSPCEYLDELKTRLPQTLWQVFSKVTGFNEVNINYGKFKEAIIEGGQSAGDAIDSIIRWVVTTVASSSAFLIKSILGALAEAGIEVYYAIEMDPVEFEKYKRLKREAAQLDRDKARTAELNRREAEQQKRAEELKKAKGDCDNCEDDRLTPAVLNGLLCRDEICEEEVQGYEFRSKLPEEIRNAVYDKLSEPERKVYELLEPQQKETFIRKRADNMLGAEAKESKHRIQPELPINGFTDEKLLSEKDLLPKQRFIFPGDIITAKSGNMERHICEVLREDKDSYYFVIDYANGGKLAKIDKANAYKSLKYKQATNGNSESGVINSNGVLETVRFTDKKDLDDKYEVIFKDNSKHIVDTIRDTVYRRPISETDQTVEVKKKLSVSGPNETYIIRDLVDYSQEGKGRYDIMEVMINRGGIPKTVGRIYISPEGKPIKLRAIDQTTLEPVGTIFTVNSPEEANNIVNMFFDLPENKAYTELVKNLGDSAFGMEVSNWDPVSRQYPTDNLQLAKLFLVDPIDETLKGSIRFARNQEDPALDVLNSSGATIATIQSNQDKEVKTNELLKELEKLQPNRETIISMAKQLAGQRADNISVGVANDENERIKYNKKYNGYILFVYENNVLKGMIRLNYLTTEFEYYIGEPKESMKESDWASYRGELSNLPEVVTGKRKPEILQGNNRNDFNKYILNNLYSEDSIYSSPEAKDRIESAKKNLNSMREASPDIKKIFEGNVIKNVNNYLTSLIDVNDFAKNIEDNDYQVAVQIALYILGKGKTVGIIDGQIGGQTYRAIDELLDNLNGTTTKNSFSNTSIIEISNKLNEYQTGNSYNNWSEFLRRNYAYENIGTTMDSHRININYSDPKFRNTNEVFMSDQFEQLTKEPAISEKAKALKLNRKEVLDAYVIFAAITSQESNPSGAYGGYGQLGQKLIRPSIGYPERAIGRYQIMPFEWREWSDWYLKETYKDSSYGVILPTPKNQDIVAFCRMLDLYNAAKILQPKGATTIEEFSAYISINWYGTGGQTPTDMLDLNTFSSEKPTNNVDPSPKEYASSIVTKVKATQTNYNTKYTSRL